jgi:uncharacterized protein YrrD
MHVNDLTGMAVVALDEADRLGTISNVLFRTEPLRVAGLRIEDRDQSSMVLPFDAVRSVGDDAVTVERRDLASEETRAQTTGLIDLGDLHALKIVDEEGTFLGTVDRIDIDDDGRVVGIDAQRGGVMGVGGTSTQIDLDAIRRIGPELLTVRTGATTAPRRVEDVR